MFNLQALALQRVFIPDRSSEKHTPLENDWKPSPQGGVCEFNTISAQTLRLCGVLVDDFEG